jgi:hypothetical protein
MKVLLKIGWQRSCESDRYSNNQQASQIAKSEKHPYRRRFSYGRRKTEFFQKDNGNAFAQPERDDIIDYRD